MASVRACLFAVILSVAACLTGCRSGDLKRVQDLSDAEQEALESLTIRIYKEAFDVLGPGDEKPESGGYRTALFRGVTFYALPSDLTNRLDEPIESVSMHSGFVWDSGREVREKIAEQVGRWSVRIDGSGEDGRTLRIADYEVDHMLGAAGLGSSLTTITIVPIRVEISNSH